MTTVLQFLEDAYQDEIDATVVAVRGSAVVLDRTIYYPGIGVSTPDCATIIRSDGHKHAVLGGAWSEDGSSELWHIMASGSTAFSEGDIVKLKVDWLKRHLHMRVHTALHVVSTVFPFRIVGGRIGAGEGHIDFHADRTAMSASLLQHQAQRVVDDRLPIEIDWSVHSELESDERVSHFVWAHRPGHVRTIRIGKLSTHACDGLHVRNTSEIGSVVIRDILPLGSEACRVRVSLLERRGFPFLAHHRTS